MFGTPKTHQRRTVPLPGFLIDDLRPVVEGRSPTELVFTGPGGWGAPARAPQQLSETASRNRLRTRCGLNLFAAVPAWHYEALRNPLTRQNVL